MLNRSPSPDARCLACAALVSVAADRAVRFRSGISVKDVIGDNESLSSPYHNENVARLRSQTHEDWNRAHIQTYRRKLRRMDSE